MPSYSTGFWVAMTANGSGRGWASPSTLTWRSSMDSSSDAWVLGGVRLISSASRRLVKTGPGRKRKLRSASSTSWPVTSEGIRSGVNCRRLNSRSKAPATAFTSRVLATPGTPSRSTCPPTSSAATMPDSVPSWPTTTLLTSCRTALIARRGSSALGGGSGPLGGGGGGDGGGGGLTGSVLLMEDLPSNHVDVSRQCGQGFAVGDRATGHQVPQAVGIGPGAFGGGQELVQ